MCNFYFKTKILQALFLLIFLHFANMALSQTADSATVVIKSEDGLHTSTIILLHKKQQKSALLQSIATVYTNQLITTPVINIGDKTHFNSASEEKWESGLPKK